MNDAAQSALDRMAERVRQAARERRALEIHGGRTKHFYGNAPQGEPLDVRSLNGITSYEPTELVVTALAGTTLVELEAALADAGQFLPFEPPRFGAGGTVGGMVAAGLSGPARLAAGPVRDYVLGVTLLDGRGDVLSFGGQVMKNVAGYDVSRVLAGSLGVLGVLCEVSLKVMPLPPATLTLAFELDMGSGIDAVNHWAGQALPLAASAWYQNRLLVRFAGAQTVIGALPAQLGGESLSSDAAAAWWAALRDHTHECLSMSEAALASGEALWRLSVPPATPPLLLAGEQLVGWGGGERWLRTRLPAATVRAAAAAVRGHATLVRGRDKSAGAFASPGAALLQIHRRLKQIFDPSGIFNPGRLYPNLS